MLSPEITPEEALRWQDFLRNFNLDLMTTYMDKWSNEQCYVGTGVFPVALRYLDTKEYLKEVTLS